MTSSVYGFQKNMDAITYFLVCRILVWNSGQNTWDKFKKRDFLLTAKIKEQAVTQK
jgi:uncharacterized protein (DUF302 family)